MVAKKKTKKKKVVKKKKGVKVSVVKIAEPVVKFFFNPTDGRVAGDFKHDYMVPGAELTILNSVGRTKHNKKYNLKYLVKVRFEGQETGYDLVSPQFIKKVKSKKSKVTEEVGD